MRTSGRSGSETLMFIAPAAIFGGFFVWLFGDPYALVVAVDRAVVRGAMAVAALVSALLS